MQILKARGRKHENNPETQMDSGSHVGVTKKQYGELGGKWVAWLLG